ncbi:MAG: NAD-dependent epimerase/dehydratase family protein, partial [Candidatus Acidiferrales bacterium]
MPACLVTGGAGFIGSNLVAELLRQNWRVRVLDNFSTGKRSHLDRVLAAAQANTFELVEGDIRNRDDCLNACREVEYVFHQAALRSVPRSVDDPSATNEVNVLGTLNVLQAAVKAGVRRFVYASSSSVYGDTSVSPQQEDHRPGPISPYAVSKLAGEHYSVSFCQVYG